MRRSRFTEDEIETWLSDADAGAAIEDICRAAHISTRTFYRWREKYGLLPAKAMRNLARLEEENRALRQTIELTGTALRTRPIASAETWRDSAAAPPGGSGSTRTSSAYRNCRSH
jgi:putative transposase